MAQRPVKRDYSRPHTQYYSYDATARAIEYTDVPAANPAQYARPRRRAKANPFWSTAAVVQAVLLVAIALFTGGALVSQYEKISSLNTSTSTLSREISIYAEELEALQVDLACSVDLASVSQKAEENDMNYPNDEQVIQLPLEKTAPVPLARSAAKFEAE